MNNEAKFRNGCSEEFAELCALSTSGELSAEELATLEEHLAGCKLCAELLREYTSVAHTGIAKLAAELQAEIEIPLGYSEPKAEERFADVLHSLQSNWRSKVPAQIRLSAAANSSWRIPRPVFLIATAALLLVCIGGAFELGRRMTPAPARAESSPIVAAPLAVEFEKGQLKAELTAAQSSLKAITARSADLEKQLAELSALKTSLATQISELTQKDNSASASLTSVTQQRDGLQQQLSDATIALTRAKEDSTRAQQDRQGAQYRVATLETEVNDLHTELAATNSSTTSDEKFLAADRDIRELMGARNLYIADVFDVQNNGERSKPFGRVFYTKGKSLIFYAFDLEKQSGYREANTFQAWGKPDSASARPISLGIFYMDNEQNRRWVVKSDNTQILAQINAVFVTVEPQGGSQKPTGKPFLEAYLHSLPPNHP
jgi:predicted  nucleic acid-binding Zn-ribbon protein